MNATSSLPESIIGTLPEDWQKSQSEEKKVKPYGHTEYIRDFMNFEEALIKTLQRSFDQALGKLESMYYGAQEKFGIKWVGLHAGIENIELYKAIFIATEDDIDRIGDELLSYLLEESHGSEFDIDVLLIYESKHLNLRRMASDGYFTYYEPKPTRAR